MKNTIRYNMKESIKDNIFEDTDVIVCGGGPAGVAAAIAAARAGVRTRLIEMQGCLGGIWTSGLMSWILDCDNKPGIMKEIIEKLEQRGAGRKARAEAFICDPEEMKLLLEEMCIEAGVGIRLYTRVTGAQKSGLDNNKEISCITTESKSGRQQWKAKVYIDCTGDGDLCAAAGCGFDIGKPVTGEMQPMSLIAIIGGIDPESVRAFDNSLPYIDDRTAKQNFLEELRKAGVEPSYTAPSLFHVRGDLFIVMINHEFGYSGINASHLTEATIEARTELHKMIKALRGLGGIWEKVGIIFTAPMIGVREGRRIHGRYSVTLDDITNGFSHDDSVCKVTFGIDVHSLNRSDGEAYMKHDLRVKPYEIPLRALIAKDVDGLLMAGRCISGDFYAHSSYRVTGNAVTLGSAAGDTAALAIKIGKMPHEI